MTDEQLDVVVKRSIHRGRIWSAYPQLVLQDTADELITLGVPGTICHVPRHKGEMGAVRQSFESGVWELEKITWKRFIAVIRHRPGRYYNVMHLFEPDTGEFLAWYVNFERPIVRHDDGLVLDTMSLWLDLIVLPDGKTFWKDTDHWNWAAENGLFTETEVATVERLRDELMTAAAERSGPFDGAWTEWSPIELEPLGLPDYWDRPAAPVDTRERLDRH